MQAGDRVLYVAERNAQPQTGTVVRRYGTWVDVQLDDGTSVDCALAAAHHFQSPRGHYCVSTQPSVIYHGSTP